MKLIISGDARIQGSDRIKKDSKASNPVFEFGFVASASSSPSDIDLEIMEMDPIVFSDPLLVATSDLPQCEVEKCGLLSYVILYNLALSYHLRGMDEEVHHLRVAYLEKAMALYEHSHVILSNHHQHISLLHTMAITSNLGHIHQSVGDQERASRCFKHLLSIILYTVDCGGAQGIELFLDGFFQNVMALICSVNSAAAA